MNKTNDKFFHSVTLDPSICQGCINCLKRCPTEAIRVKQVESKEEEQKQPDNVIARPKASIIKERCTDCGECIRVCPHHAKIALFDKPEKLDEYKYKIALPPPSLYAQFNNIEDKALIIDALISYGFDDVYEVAAAAEMISEKTRELLKKEKNGVIKLDGGREIKLPLISAACPSIVRLIRARFPNLIDKISPLVSPMELAADLAVSAAIKKTGLSREEIGVFFITPCPAKVTAVYAPLTDPKTNIDGVLAMREIYPLLLPHLKKVYNSSNSKYYYEQNVMTNPSSGRIGVSWGREGGESAGLLIEKYLSADGISNVIRVLEDLEDDKLSGVEFIELNACPGGCVGGVLAVENPYIAKVKMNMLRKYLPVSGSHLSGAGNVPPKMFFTGEIEYSPAFNLGGTVSESIEIMKRSQEILKILPGFDCGCCGAPSCRAHAEDIATGKIASHTIGTGKPTDKQCIYLLKDYLENFVNEFKKL